MRRRVAVAVSYASLFLVALTVPLPAAAASCESLRTLSLTDTTIVSVGSVPAGAFSPPITRAPAAGAPAIRVPAFCRVVGVVRPAINFEVWMPATGWNGKFQGVGGSGYAGVISYAAMGAALNRGYATASTDTGHTGGTGSALFALGHPELVVDFGHRAIYEMTLKAKALVGAFYERAPARSYFVGCSTGGRQGLMEAQRYPIDYDGIVAGSSATFYGHHHAAQLWVASATLKDEAGYLPPSTYPLINKAVLAACDARDGVSDGLLEDPRRCRFDAKTLLCSSGRSDACLTAPQVETVQKIYSAVRNPRTGQEIFPALPPGSELSWATQAAGPEPSRLATEFFKYFVFEDPNWDWRTFDFDRDVSRADAKIGPIVTAMDPDLTAFNARGGKVIMYHGWNDQLIAPENSVNYYNSVVALFGAHQTDRFFRLFMGPGMQHCGGGPGPNTFDAVSVLERWVEEGQVPQQITASHSTDGVVDRTRPLCPYPQVAVYKGRGSIDEAANFECKILPSSNTAGVQLPGERQQH